MLAPGFELLFPPGTNVDPRPDILVANRVNYETGSRNNVFLRVIAKLKPGVSFEQAQSELDRLSADLRARFPDQADGRTEPADRADARTTWWPTCGRSWWR